MANDSFDSQGQDKLGRTIPEKVKKRNSIFKEYGSLGLTTDDFIFKDDDTFAIIEVMEYSQDKMIPFQPNKVQKDASFGTNRDRKGEQSERDIPDDSLEGHIKVRHLLDISNIKFMYTAHIVELIHHHLVRGFNYKSYRKTDYIDVEQLKAKKRLLASLK